MDSIRCDPPGDAPSQRSRCATTPGGASRPKAKYLGDNDLNEIVDDIALVSDMLVEGHGLDVQTLADSPHRHGVEAGLIGEAKHRNTRSRDRGMRGSAPPPRSCASIGRALLGVRGERSREFDPRLLGMPS
ncbi:hypothetical protein WME79_15620 [Sorangium sp. So ce726]|uniref:hypothetical protein n=1 Tax=Sorangium sp. So ce726 TaxID=3133319 RepID=UPI003F60CDBE